MDMYKGTSISVKSMAGKSMILP